MEEWTIKTVVGLVVFLLLFYFIYCLFSISYINFEIIYFDPLTNGQKYVIL